MICMKNFRKIYNFLAVYAGLIINLELLTEVLRLVNLTSSLRNHQLKINFSCIF